MIHGSRFMVPEEVKSGPDLVLISEISISALLTELKIITLSACKELNNLYIGWVGPN